MEEVMTEKERIKAYIKEQAMLYSTDTTPFSFDINTIATALGLWRTNTANALNLLVEEGFLKKISGRPIRYSLSTSETGTDKCTKNMPRAARQTNSAPAHAPAAQSFKKIIGSNGSLKLQTQLGKTAAAYPPHGIHTLILGETGVGKSLMAEEIWNYFREIHSSESVQPPFIVFNCAEYSENPQLLLSQLFGHERGAFTGAVETKIGLIEKANGGILFLDEIHRLPATGQEMLFTVIDKGIYRRLGGINEQHADLMIIGATTESPESTLLSTFMRRIPMTIQIPALSERPIKERLELIILFFSQEAAKLNLPIKISEKVLKMLISYKSSANVGDLKNEIQMCCAKSYLSYYTEANDNTTDKMLFINSYHLSRKIETSTVEHSNIFDYFGSIAFANNIIIYPDGTTNNALPEIIQDNNKLIDFYNFLENKSPALYNSEKPGEESDELFALKLKEYYSESVIQLGTDFHKTLNKQMYGSISTEVWNVTKELIRHASLKFSRIFPKHREFSIALYLQQTRDLARANRAVFNKRIPHLHNEAEETFVSEMLSFISDNLDIKLNPGEISILALLLARPQEIVPSLETDPALIIMAHGNSTASSISSFVNQMVNQTVAYAIDIPFNCNKKEAYHSLCRAIQLRDNGSGAIIFTDVSTFYSAEQELLEATGSSCKVIPSINTALIFEVCNNLINPPIHTETSLHDIIQAYHRYEDSLLKQCEERLSVSTSTSDLITSTDKQNIIITYCTTGIGSARTAKEILEREALISATTDILPLGSMDDIYKISEELGPRLKVIIGLLNPHISNIPFIKMESILSSNGIQKVISILNGNNTESFQDSEDIDGNTSEFSIEQLKERMHFFAPSLDAQTTFQQVQRIIEALSCLYKQPLSQDLILRVFIHTAAMLERISLGEPVEMSLEGYETISKNYSFFKTLKNLLKTACDEWDIAFNDTEIYYFMLILPPAEQME